MSTIFCVMYWYEVNTGCLIVFMIHTVLISGAYQGNNNTSNWAGCWEMGSGLWFTDDGHYKVWKKKLKPGSSHIATI